jgi:hypothetical protein
MARAPRLSWARALPPGLVGPGCSKINVSVLLVLRYDIRRTETLIIVDFPGDGARPRHPTASATMTVRGDRYYDVGTFTFEVDSDRIARFTIR